MKHVLPPDKSIILFDGECLFCQSWVQYIIRHDSLDLFRFSSLQSDFGKGLLAHFGLANDLSSVVLLHQSKIYSKSNVPLKVSSLLGYPHKLLSVFKHLPQGFRNSIYDLIARIRYKIWGRSEVCEIPSQALRYKFI